MNYRIETGNVTNVDLLSRTLSIHMASGESVTIHFASFWGNVPDQVVKLGDPVEVIYNGTEQAPRLLGARPAAAAPHTPRI